MRKIRAILLVGLASAALSAAAFAASHDRHIMSVVLPDGFVAHIAYEGNVAPRVTIDPAGPVDAGFGIPGTGSPFGMIDGMIAQLNRQAEMIAQSAAVAPRVAAGPGEARLASFGNLPTGSTSTTVISTSDGRTTCTRTTQVFANAPRKPPKVVSNVSGECPMAGQPPANGAPQNGGPPSTSAKPFDRT